MQTKFAIALMLALSLMATDACAIGISPSRIILNFTPNEVINLYAVVINGQDAPLNVQLYVRGDLAQFVDFPASSATIPAKGSQTFEYTLTMPPSLAGPRRYDTRIGAVEVPEGGWMVGAVAGVEAQLWVDAPEGEGWSPPPEGTQPQPSGSEGPAAEQPGGEQPSGEEAPVTQERGQAAAMPLLGLALLIGGAVLGAIVIVIAAYTKKSERRARAVRRGRRV